VVGVARRHGARPGGQDAAGDSRPLGDDDSVVVPDELPAPDELSVPVPVDAAGLEMVVPELDVVVPPELLHAARAPARDAVRAIDRRIRLIIGSGSSVARAPAIRHQCGQGDHDDGHYRRPLLADPYGGKPTVAASSQRPWCFVAPPRGGVQGP
jgi:hypothetical protein